MQQERVSIPADQRPRSLVAAVAVAIVLGAAGAISAQPVIDSLSEATVDRSGRLRILGSGFGASGEVWIDGWQAIVAEWSTTRIHAYVPESAGPGVVGVQVVTSSGTSGTELLEVTLRQREGQVMWRFSCDSFGVRQQVGVGPDGSVYAQDTSGLLYALTADGGLRWLVDTGDVGSEGPVVVGADGTVYVGVNPLGEQTQIRAYDPDGNEVWTFTTTGGQGIIAGPGIGPDGNLYAVTDFGGIGAFSLDPQGDLRWSHVGDPPIAEFAQRGQEIGFGEDRFFVAFDEGASHPTSLLFGFSYDGDQLFAVPRPDDLAGPAVGPDGSVYLQVWGAGGTQLGAYDADGTPQWSVFGTPTNNLSRPAVTPSGSIYTVRNLHELWAVSPAGGTALVTTEAGGNFQGPATTPDGELIVTTGSVSGGDGFVRAHRPNGDLAWEEVLPPRLGGTVFPSARPLMHDDGSVVYVPAEPVFNPDDDRLCYVYALATDASAALFADGFESGDTAAWSSTVFD